MVYNAETSQKKKREKNNKNEPANAYLTEDIRTYDIDCLNLGKHKNDSDSDSE